MKKVYVIRKYIAAKSVLDAIQKERHTPIHECFIDDSWLREQAPNLNRMLRIPVKNDKDDNLLEEID